MRQRRLYFEDECFTSPVIGLIVGLVVAALAVGILAREAAPIVASGEFAILVLTVPAMLRHPWVGAVDRAATQLAPAVHDLRDAARRRALAFFPWVRRLVLTNLALILAAVLEVLTGAPIASWALDALGPALGAFVWVSTILVVYGVPLAAWTYRAERRWRRRGGGDLTEAPVLLAERIAGNLPGAREAAHGRSDSVATAAWVIGLGLLMLQVAPHVASAIGRLS